MNDFNPPHSVENTSFDRPGPDWEDSSQPLIGRWFRTTKKVFLAPDTFFQTMRIEGGISSPLVYCIIGMLLGAAVYVLWQVIMQFIGLSMSGLTAAGPPHPERPQMGGMLAGFFLGTFFAGACALIMVPVIGIVFTFLWSGLLHVLLMFVGGARSSYEATFRVVCYASGALSILHLIPICGYIIMSVYILVVLTFGLMRAHGASVGQALFAVLFPYVVCCVIGIGAFAFVMMTANAGSM